MWLMPSRRRIPQLQQFFEHCRATGISTPGRVLVEDEELTELIVEYRSITLPDGWLIVGVHAEGMAEKIEYAYAEGYCGDARWIGVLTDDQQPITAFWDRKLIARLNGYNAVSSDDLDQAPKRMEGATVWSRDLVDAIGYMAPPGLHHLFFDDVQERLGIATGCLTWDMSVKVKHSPITYSGVADSTAEKVKSFHDDDQRTFQAWLAAPDGYAAAVDRIMRLTEAKGGKVVRPDLAGVSLYVATPSGDGTFDRVYVRSLMQTIDKVRSAGGKIDWAEMPYCADLSLARNRIFGAFMSSPHTHMLMSDADIGWHPDDALRLLMTKLDFVGGAGPKKHYPLRFCIYSKDESGRPMLGEFSDATQTLEVTGIGTGFLMISKAAGERMQQAYPELIFDPGEGQTEYGLFDPLIENRRRFSDDFAFCRRWRAIGGKVHVMPSIRLKHVGSHCFEGSLLETMLAEPERIAAE